MQISSVAKPVARKQVEVDVIIWNIDSVCKVEIKKAFQIQSKTL